ncbi:hypothetical protein HDU85_001249 [Gaertneriomyces sp. JEL0708]|nr:hypothetical protein HDU85_001249 [Gaertneriomyces sp. JEL0708]
MLTWALSSLPNVFSTPPKVVFYQVHNESLPNSVEVIEIVHSSSKAGTTLAARVYNFRDTFAKRAEVNPFQVTVHSHGTDLTTPLGLAEPLPVTSHDSPLTVKIHPLNLLLSEIAFRPQPPFEELPCQPSRMCIPTLQPQMQVHSDAFNALSTATDADRLEVAKFFGAVVKPAGAPKGEYQNAVIVGSFEVASYAHGSHQHMAVGTELDVYLWQIQRVVVGTVSVRLDEHPTVPVDAILIRVPVELEPPYTFPVTLGEVFFCPHEGHAGPSQDSGLPVLYKTGRITKINFAKSSIMLSGGFNLGDSGTGIFDVDKTLIGMMVGAVNIPRMEHANSAICVTADFMQEWATLPLWLTKPFVE